MTIKNGGKLLVGAEAIMKYMGIGRKLFDQFVEMKMPARPPSMAGGKWLAHTDNLDDWARSITRVQPAGTHIRESEDCQ